MSRIPSIDTLRDEFTFLDDMEDKFRYLIDLGGKLPEFPYELRDRAHAVPGCTAQVWMDYGWQDGRLNMRLMSDASIVSGLLAIMMAAYNDRTPDEIMATDPKALFASLGLEGQMTANRRNGFVAVSGRIQALAQLQAAGKMPAPGQHTPSHR